LLCNLLLKPLLLLTSLPNLPLLLPLLLLLAIPAGLIQVQLLLPLLLQVLQAKNT
jgi:hypothetical protein